MNDRPHFARLAAEALAAERPVQRPPDPESEAQIIEAMAERIAREGRRRTLRRAGVVLASAAVFALVGLAAARARHHEPVAVAPPPPPVAAAPAPAPLARIEATGASLVHDGTSTAIDGAALLAEGDRLVARADRPASIVLSSGSRLAFDPGADVTVLRQGPALMFAIDAGSMRVMAAAGDAPLVVRTRDMSVEARGASVRITTGDPVLCGGRRTLVEVEAGAATVHDGAQVQRVAAGDEWPSGCALKEEAPPTSPPTPRASAHGPRARTPRETSVLRAQVALFQEALGARKSGDASTALTRFDEYLATYPDSQLAESAAVNRMELLDRVDHARGVDAARAYLQRYPAGFMRDEAAKIARGAP